MMNKIFRTLLIIIAHGMWATAIAQSDYRYQDAIQTWRNTDMAAGLTVDTTVNRGIARFNFFHQQGDYHRVQEGSMQNQLQFFTERYQRIGRYLYGYGRFQFDMGRTKERAWSDVQQTYGGTPFIVGSNVAGKYDNQSFDLTAAVGTVALGHWRTGLRLDYKVSDLSRLRDPRSRSQLLDYKLTPSVTCSFGKSTVGAAAFYHRRKEKIPNINTVQNDPNLMYYLMSGLEAASGTTGGYKGFNREWVNHEFGGSLAYHYQGNGLSSLTTLSLSRGQESVYETYKREPGQYNTCHYGLHTQNRLERGTLLHELDVRADYVQGYADEYRQQLQIENDPETGYTSYSYQTLITFMKRFQAKLFDLNLRYRLNFTCEEGIDGYVGLSGAIATVRQKHLLPTSQWKRNTADITLEGGKALLKNHSLWIDAAATYHNAGKHDLALADATTDYARQVLLPDLEYYRANYWQGRLAVTYHFPMTIKGYRSTWFVKAYGSYLKTNNSLDASTVGASFGITY